MGAAAIVDDLTDRIRSGQYLPGSRLPSYAELAALYSVSESTIAKVVLVLRERRVVEGQKGRGLFVPERRDAEDYFG